MRSSSRVVPSGLSTRVRPSSDASPAARGRPAGDGVCRGRHGEPDCPRGRTAAGGVQTYLGLEFRSASRRSVYSACQAATAAPTAAAVPDAPAAREACRFARPPLPPAPAPSNPATSPPVGSSARRARCGGMRQGRLRRRSRHRTEHRRCGRRGTCTPTCTARRVTSMALLPGSARRRASRERQPGRGVGSAGPAPSARTERVQGTWYSSGSLCTHVGA